MDRGLRKARHAVTSAGADSASASASAAGAGAGAGAANTSTEPTAGAATSAVDQSKTAAPSPADPALNGTGLGSSAAGGEDDDDDDNDFASRGAWATSLRAEPLGQVFDQEMALVENSAKAEAYANPPALALDLSDGDLVDVDLNQ